jgi:hypothetical protein
MQALSMSGDFGIPKGCVVRNTFLEWQVYEDESTKDGNSSSGSDDCDSPVVRLYHLYPDPDEGNSRRCLSCPPRHFSGSTLPTPRSEQSSEESGSKSAVKSLAEARLLMSARLQAWSEQKDMEDAIGDSAEAEGSGSSPWTRKSSREDADQGKRNSPTSFSGKTSSSGVDSQDSQQWHDYKDYYGSSKSRSREYDSYDSWGTGSKSASPNILSLRGLPFSTTEDEVYTFIEELGCTEWLAQIAKPITLVENAQGKPTGFAEITLAKTADFGTVRSKIHLQYFGKRYVEVMPQKAAFCTGRGGGGRRGDRDRPDDRFRDNWRRR